MQVLTIHLRNAEARNDLDPLTCGSLLESYVIFVDDLMIFLKADKKNARNLKLVLEDFTALSSLTINSSKSAIFFGGLVKHQNWIAAHLDLTPSKLPVKYLGLSLLSKRLFATECSPLLQAITMRLQTWKAKLLSYAGRTELIKSVLSSMHLYWTSIFILSACILQDIDCLMLRFLWYGHGPKNAFSLRGNPASHHLQPSLYPPSSLGT